MDQKKRSIFEKDPIFKVKRRTPEPVKATPPAAEVIDEGFAPACTQIFDWIEQTMIGDRSTDVNRASSAPNCVKQRWYASQGRKGEPLNARSIITFGFGDLTEHWMKDLIKKACVGPDKLYSEVDFGLHKGTFTVQHMEFQDYEQEDLDIEIPNGPKVTGHADGWGKRNSDGQWELIEVKSSALRGYDKFVSGEEPDYIRQVHALMLSTKAKALKVRSARFFYMNKNTSHIFDRLYKFDREVAMQVVREFIVAAGSEEPKAPFSPSPEMSGRGRTAKPTGRAKLDYPCSYCPFKKECMAGGFGEIEMEFKNGKPVWYLITDARKESCG